MPARPSRSRAARACSTAGSTWRRSRSAASSSRPASRTVPRAWRASRRASARSASCTRRATLLRNVFQESPAFMAALSGPRHVFQMVNGRYKRLLGGREVIGKPVAEALPEVVPQGYIEILDRVYFPQRRTLLSARTSRACCRPSATSPPQQRFFMGPGLPAAARCVGRGVGHPVPRRRPDGAQARRGRPARGRRRSCPRSTAAAPTSWRRSPHELRNPLAPLRNGLQIMRMASGDPALIGRARDMMERQRSPTSCTWWTTCSTSRASRAARSS